MYVNFDLVMFGIYLCATYELSVRMGRNWNGVMGMVWRWNESQYWEWEWEGMGMDCMERWNGKKWDSENPFPGIFIMNVLANWLSWLILLSKQRI